MCETGRGNFFFFSLGTKFDFIFLLFETERQKIKVEVNQSKMFLFCEDNNQSCCSGNIFAAEWSFY